RNAIGGPMAQCIRDVADHEFFCSKVQFSNRRYQHRETAARLLFIEFSTMVYRRLLDTKKPYLDDMVRHYKENHSAAGLAKLRARALHTLNLLDSAFNNQDSLLRAQGVVSIFYLTIQAAEKAHKLRNFAREGIEEFNEKLNANRKAAETDIAKANFEWLEFDRLSQQGTNDATSIRERVKI